MLSPKILGRISVVIGLIVLFALSLRGPANDRADISMLMEPDGTGRWQDLIQQFQREHPDIKVRLVEGPAATDTREDMYSTSFLSGEAAYDIVYCVIVRVPKFSAAAWLLDRTDCVCSDDAADVLPAAARSGSYRSR